MIKNNKVIESKFDLIRPFEDGEKKNEDLKIGTEH